jgi:hypothetical protein
MDNSVPNGKDLLDGNVNDDSAVEDVMAPVTGDAMNMGDNVKDPVSSDVNGLLPLEDGAQKDNDVFAHSDYQTPEPDNNSFQQEQSVTPQVEEMKQPQVPVSKASGSHKKMIVGGALALTLLLVGVPLVVLGLQSFNGDIRQRASEPKAIVAPQQAVSNQSNSAPTNQVQTQVQNKYMIQTDVNNQPWQEMMPDGVQAKMENGNVVVTWNDKNSDPNGFTYMWLVAYSDEAFNPAETFSNFNSSDGKVVYQKTTSPISPLSVNLKLNRLTKNSGEVYYAFIRRVEYADGKTDFIYGNNGAVTPFSIKTK